MKVKVDYTAIFKNNICFTQKIDVWFNDKEFEIFKRKCYQIFKNNYYAFYEIEMSLETEELNKISKFLNLDSYSNFKPKANTIIIYHKDFEQQ